MAKTQNKTRDKKKKYKFRGDPKLEKIKNAHRSQNYRIRASRKPIVKPDLDAIMEAALAE